MKVAITGKGGVGKTTLSSTLARLYADEGRTVLAADVDPDANLGLALGLTQDEVDAMLEEATMNANRRGERIVADAQDKADGIIRQAQTEAEMEKKKAQATIRQEITEVSAALAEKLLQRELTGDDHTGMINAFLDEMGDKQ